MGTTVRAYIELTQDMPRLYCVVLIPLLGDMLPLVLEMLIAEFGIWRLKHQRCVTRPGAYVKV